MSKRSDHEAGRRRFVISCALAAAIPLVRHPAHAQQSGEKVDENSAQAKALNYRHNAKEVKDPKRKADQFCHNCQFFQGKATDAWAPCAVFGGKQVANQGWCSSWVKKV